MTSPYRDDEGATLRKQGAMAILKAAFAKIEAENSSDPQRHGRLLIRMMWAVQESVDGETFNVQLPEEGDR